MGTRTNRNKNAAIKPAAEVNTDKPRQNRRMQQLHEITKRNNVNSKNSVTKKRSSNGSDNEETITSVIKQREGKNANKGKVKDDTVHTEDIMSDSISSSDASDNNIIVSEPMYKTSQYK